jgi:hypothetical protein
VISFGKIFKHSFSASKMENLEEITSKEFLDKSLENAKSWCSAKLPQLLLGIENVDYGIFHYKTEGDAIGISMRLDKDEKGLIRVFPEQIKVYQKRENAFKNASSSYVEVDPESMFVGAIANFLSYDNSKVLYSYFLKEKKFTPANAIARKIENINRKERGLKEWIYDSFI